MTTLREMFEKEEFDQIWSKHCGFLNLNIKEFMKIQERLLLEQIDLLSQCQLGKKLIGDNTNPKSIDEFRELVKLTTYEDYAEVLLNKREEQLPAKPQYWIQTTWKGGKHGIKLAPYSESMIQEHSKAFIASLLLATSKKKGEFTLRNYDKFLYGMAPLPYLTGLAPHGIKNEIDFEYLPPIERAEFLTFEERNMLGFEMAFNRGVDVFFGLSSVLVKIGEDFAQGPCSSLKNFKPRSVKMYFRFIKAEIKSKLFKQQLLPKDLWKIKGIICAGTDTHAFKDKIEYYWGKRPLEIYGGTEIATVATETSGDGNLTFFPDVNFLEFIPERESLQSTEDKNFIPKTLLLNEITPGNRYELVTTKFRGGVFVRYRVGDIIECISLRNEEYNINLPQIRFVDRISDVIDLAGFTRITSQTIEKAIDRSDISISDWIACKVYEKNIPKIKLFIEISEASITEEIAKLILDMKLCEIDGDYRDLHNILGMDPLVVTILKNGTLTNFKNIYNEKISQMNPSKDSLSKLMQLTKQ